MLRSLSIITLSAIFAVTSFAGEKLLKGTYQGENLYVKNPFAASGVGFCIYEVTVNGLTTTDEINSSAFEVDLSVYSFEIGEALTIGIKFKDDCEPVIMNAENLEPRAVYEMKDIKIQDKKMLWSTINEAGALPFIVEQYRWNKWVKVGDVLGKGNSSMNSYSSPLRFHSGENRFRIKQIDYRNKPRYSEEVYFMSEDPIVTFSPKRVDDHIDFSAPTLYEIYDEYGSIMFKGYGKRVNALSLKKGKYYLNFDNQMSDFNKK